MGVKKRIGIPRALLYYKYFPFWKTFFEELGMEVVASGKSTKELLHEGNMYAIDEICIPLKLFYGHIKDVLRKNIDYIFIPRYVSISPETYMCPKFLALPDMVRATVNGLPPVLEMSVDMKKKPLFISAYETGRQLDKPLRLIKRAYGKAADSQSFFIKAMEKGYPFEEALALAERAREDVPEKSAPGDAKAVIALIGHGYNIHDSFINMDILKKLEKMEAAPVVIENLPSEIFDEGETNISRSLKNYWGNEEEILSALNYLFGQKYVDGIIFLCSFCCGPDSLIDEITTRNAKTRGIPYTCVVLDEHAGQAGLITRIESFVEMVVMRKMAKEEAGC